MKLARILIILAFVTVIVSTTALTTRAQGPAEAEPGQEVNMVLIPKALGIAVFDQAHEGAQQAHEELENPGDLAFIGPASADAAAGQIEIVTAATTEGAGAIMLSNGASDQIAPAAQEALDAGIPVVTWDSPIPSGEGESLFIAQVDFDETGVVMADMALKLLGEEGGQIAILSATPDSANQNLWIAAMEEVLAEDETYANLEIIDIVYGNDVPEDSYEQALALIDQYENLDLIMAPTTVGIAAAAKVVQDEDLCGEILVSGLGFREEMQGFVEDGCAQDFALWSFADLGYTTYYVAYLLATGAIEGVEGETFLAGHMGELTIEADPTREGTGALRVVMGPFSVWSPEDIDEWRVETE